MAHFCLQRPDAVSKNGHKILIDPFFNTQPNRPNASPAIFKQLRRRSLKAYSNCVLKRGFKILAHEIATGPAHVAKMGIKILSALFSTHNLIGPWVGDLPYNA